MRGEGEKQMKKLMTGVMVAAVAAMVAMPAAAMNMGSKQMEGHQMSGKTDGKMDHSKMNSETMGDMIHESMAGGHMLAYHLIDNKAQMDKIKDMKGMKGMKMGSGAAQMKSHHLMTYPMKDGKPLGGAKVGYQIEGPDGAKQQAMAMEMKGGYGADVELGKKGVYKIKMKAAKGDTKILDSFDYEVK